MSLPLEEGARRTPVTHETEVLVVGGGSAGVAAAVDGVPGVSAAGTAGSSLRTASVAISTNATAITDPTSPARAAAPRPGGGARKASRSSARAPALTYRAAGSLARHRRQIASRRGSIVSRSALGGLGLEPTVLSSTSSTERPSTGGLPVSR